MHQKYYLQFEHYHLKQLAVFYYLQKYLARVRLSGVETRVLAGADDEPTRSFDFAQDDPVGFGVRLSIIFNKNI